MSGNCPAVLAGACAPMMHTLTATAGRQLTAGEWVRATGEATIT